MQRLARYLLIFVAIPLGMTSTAEQPSPDTDAEISRLRRELAQVQTERQRNRQESEKDQQEFKKYTERTALRFSQVKRETDSIRQEAIRYTATSDSFAGQITATQSQRRQSELNQDHLRLRLVRSCDTVSAYAKHLPPMVRGEILSSIALLKSELSSKSADNTEGANRLYQIMSQMDDAVGSIQVVQENSPLPEIRGAVYRIRYGTLFEGVVDVKGEQCATWSGYQPDDTPLWTVIADRTISSALLKAAEVREGKTLPSFVSLPLATDAVQGGVR